MSQHHHALNKRRWALTRQIVFKRDQFRCTVCGKRGRLEAHHNPPLTSGADPYDPAGVITHCRFCHIEHHKKPDDTPGRADWLTFLAEISAKNQA